MKKTLRVGAAIAAALALTLTGCSSNGSSSSDSSNDTKTSEASKLSGTLSGSGASSMGAAQDAWRAGFQTANPSVTVNYSPDGSGTGRKNFIAGAAHFAGSDSIMKDEELNADLANCADGGAISLPVYISPIALAYNLEGVDELNLNADLIAKIFAGQITNWNDEAIAKANPKAKLPDLPIVPVHRADKSGTTGNFTDTLSQIAPDIWTWGSVEEWPADAAAGEAGNKTNGVAEAIKNGNGYIGYIDDSGVEAGMGVAKYAPTGSSDYIELTPEAAAKVVDASSRVEGRAENDYSLKLDRTAAGYPFVLVSYAIACQNYKDASIGELVNAYLSYITSPEAQEEATKTAFNAPLAGELSKNVQAAAKTIK